MQLVRGGFWSGERTQYALSFWLRPGPGLSVAPAWEDNRVRLPQGSFSTSVARLTTGWQMTPLVSLLSIVQHDGETKTTGLFTRFRWELRPGADPS